MTASGVERERVAAYFSARMPDATGLEVTKVSRVVGGMSRETWLANVRWNEGGRRRSAPFALRLEPPAGSVVPVPLSWEYRVLKCLHGTRVPVARPLWYEEDRSWFGQAPFYVRELVRGSASTRDLFQPDHAAAREAVGLQFAKLLARVHTLDWHAAGLDEFMEVPRDARECATLELDRWRRYHEQNRHEAKPVTAEVFSWLRRHAPERVERVSLVWGDVGLGNFIFNRGKIVALTDWEQSHLGDPMKDWASALWRGIEGLLPRDRLFEAYERASGIRVDEESIRYYTAFINAEYIATTHAALGQYLDRTNHDVTMARMILGISYHCQDQALRAMGY